MQHRMTRLIILSLLLLWGAAAGFAVWTIERNGLQREEQREAKAATIDRLLSSITSIASAQQAYADDSRRDLAALTRVSQQVDRLTTEAAGLRAAANAGASSERLEEFWTALSALMGAESRARELFAGGEETAASDAILASARSHVAALKTSLSAFRDAEADEYRRARTTASWLERAVLGSVAAFWAIGLVAFAVRRPPQAVLEAATPPAVVSSPDLSLSPPTLSPPSSPLSSLDLAAAARLSMELSRLSDQASLEGLLANAAEVLEARGIIIWMGAGEHLAAAAAHGYEASVLRRIPPIPRDADNATASAWRTGLRARVAEDSSGYGAIVAPMLNPSGCVGVFAAEVRGGREQDEATCAVATMFASQLAGVLAAWPTSTPAIEALPLDRRSAAS